MLARVTGQAARRWTPSFLMPTARRVRHKRPRSGAGAAAAAVAKAAMRDDDASASTRRVSRRRHYHTGGRAKARAAAAVPTATARAVDATAKADMTAATTNAGTTIATADAALTTAASGAPASSPTPDSSPTARWCVESLRATLRGLGDARIAEGQAKYMRNQFPFFGVKLPVVRTAVKDMWGAACPTPLPSLSEAEVGAVVRALLAEPERELHQAAIMTATAAVEPAFKNWLAARRHAERVTEAAGKTTRRVPRPRARPATPVTAAFLAHLKTAVQTQSWWDTVDASAKPVGWLVRMFPDAGQAAMEEWLEHPDMWVRRIAILHQLCFKQDTDADRLFRFCLARCHEQEFFIRKAIGWALRDYSRTDPAAVRAFADAHRDRLSSLSYREATKYC